MKLTKEQWEFIEPLLPKAKVRKDRRGRPWRDPRDVVEAILWVLKTGARWRDLPGQYPPYQTCHRRFQQWVADGTLKKILARLVEHLRDRGKIDLTETFIDATFVEAKKGALASARPNGAREPRLWQLQTVQVFLSPYPLRALHRMRVGLLKRRFGSAIAKTFLCDLWQTKLTIVTLWMSDLQNAIASGSLLPTSQIANARQLRMAALSGATKDAGKWNASSPGWATSEE